MAGKNAKPAPLRLREISGLLEDVEINLPISWAETLRSKSAKLGLSLADFLAQYSGHLVDEIESLETAVASPTISDDAARFRLRGSFLKIFKAEALRSGLPVRTLVHRLIADAAASFAGRAREPLPKPIVMVPGQKKLGRR